MLDLELPRPIKPTGWRALVQWFRARPVIEHVSGAMLHVPHAAADVDELAEYVARAELESAIQEVCNGKPSGTGPLALHQVQQLAGERVASEVWEKLATRWGAL